MLDNSLQRCIFADRGTFWSDVDGLFSHQRQNILRRCAFFARVQRALCAMRRRESAVGRSEIAELQYDADTFRVLSHLKVNTPVTSGRRAKMYNFSGSLSVCAVFPLMHVKKFCSL